MYTGKILIAHPNLPRSNPFSKTVIYIYDHHSRGSAGLCLNIQSDTPVSEVCREHNIEYPYNHKIYQGGPVSERALLLLHSSDWSCGNTQNVKGHSYAISSDVGMLSSLSMGSTPAYWRLFAGMCAWGKGQLEMELKGEAPFRPENSWLTAEANDTIMFRYNGVKQWEKALELSSQQMIDQFF